MTFGSIEALKAYLQSKIGTAVEIAQDRIYKIFEQYLKDYYADYAPSMYERTMQLASSLIKSGVKVSGSGATAEVYFDAGVLNYTTGTWSGEQVLDSAAHGSHGGYVNGTAIWDEPIGIVMSNGKQILKDAIIAAGIPVH